jgi:hypothetical protein
MQGPPTYKHNTHAIQFKWIIIRVQWIPIEKYQHHW